jgi:uncharacterized protein YbjT (DUF2867 family)
MNASAKFFRTREAPVLVLGGTGHLGSEIVARLLDQGRPVRVLSRNPGWDDRVQWFVGDLASGDGLEAAFSGASHVIHAATNSPIARRGAIRLGDLWSSPEDVDVDGTGRALERAMRDDIRHFLYVSIVGLEDSDLPYSRVKLTGERLVRASTLPWSVVRATPFFYLVERMLDRLHRWPIWCLPNAPFRPVDARDVADHIVAHLDDDARGELPAIGGPAITSYAEMARAHLRARGLNRRIVEFKLSERRARQAGIVVSQGTHGVRSWEQWLAEQTAGIA